MFPKEALCLIGIVVWDFRYSPETCFSCVMCTNVMCIDIVDIFFTYFMKLSIH